MFCILLSRWLPSKPSSSWGEFKQVLSFVDFSKNNVITFVGTTGENLYAGGGDWMAYGTFHKSLKPLFNWPEKLTLSCELLKLDCDWLSRSQTTAETTDNHICREASPRKSLRLFLFRQQCRVHRWLAREENYKLWFEAIPFVGRRTVLSTMLAWFSRKSAHIWTRTSSSS